MQDPKLDAAIDVAFESLCKLLPELAKAAIRAKFEEGPDAARKLRSMSKDVCKLLSKAPFASKLQLELAEENDG